MLHLARVFDVVHPPDHVELPLAEDGPRLLRGPGPVVAVIVRSHVGVLGGEEGAGLAIREDLEHPVDDSRRHFPEQRRAPGLVGREVGFEQFGVVVGHFLEVRDDPPLVHRIPMEPAAHVVADAAPGHGGERFLDDLACPVEARVVPASDQEFEGGGVRELGRRAEPAVADVEQPRHLVRRLFDQQGRHRAGLRLVQRLGDVLVDRLGVLRDLLPLLAVQPRHVLQHRGEPRAAVGIVVGRKVGAAEEHLASRVQKRGQRPASLAGERGDGALIAHVHVGALVAVHLDADEVAVQQLSDVRVLVRFPVHHVAPVAPHGADVEQDRLVLGPGLRERLVAPRAPVYRLVSGGFEVGGRLGGEEVGHWACSR
ncbi:MAG: hypothetical protein AUH78_27560 [Gemmatimonadetes bacterium 13_1_40CM_4_69_8]|nr:MAG: hypothetical protein AUH78_27560 [Gemmatimonadetes bacterium 13_1_40CM_4_69_8]